MADPTTSPPLTPSGVRSAYTKIKRYIHTTPVLTSHALDAIASSPDPRLYLAENPPAFPSSGNHHDNDDATPKFKLYFKAENFQKIGAFKARGAFHAVTRLIDEVGLDEVRRRGVVTHSSGNHAQALALAASTFSIPSYIVMPRISTPSKIAGVRIYTSNVIFSGSTSQEREAVVADVIAQHNAILVPPYDHPDIILGQGTAALELQDQFQQLIDASPSTSEGEGKGKGKTLNAVITPLGGGGLLGGTATWFSEQPDTLVFGAEPSFQGGDDARRGLVEGKRIEHVKTLTIADGLRTPVGVVNWDIVSDKNKVEAVFAVSEDEIKMALRLVLERVKVVVEPSGAVGLAVVLFNREFREFVAKRQSEERRKGGQGEGDGVWHVGIVFSGGNTTVKALSALFHEDEENDKDKDKGNGVVNGGERAEGKVALDGSKTVEDVAG